MHDMTYRSNLYVGYGDVEEIVHVGEPDHPHVRDDHCPQIALVAEQMFMQTLKYVARG
jgi:hypothetical protein